MLNLSTWLDTATRDLVPSAQARIRAEIEAHYAEAVRARLEAGASEPEARAAALADLGDAKVAARRFGQEYFTQNDALTIEGIYRRSTRGYIEGCIFLFLVCLSGWMSHPGTRNSGESMIGFAILYALETPGIYFGRKWPRNLAGIDPPPASLGRLLWKHFVANLVLGISSLALVLTVPGTGVDRLFDMLLIAAIFDFSCRKLFRLHKKCWRSEGANLI